jgi:hypothetical protein
MSASKSAAVALRPDARSSTASNDDAIEQSLLKKCSGLSPSPTIVSAVRSKIAADNRTTNSAELLLVELLASRTTAAPSRRVTA